MSAFEDNEISINSNGGTELSKLSVSSYMPAELDDQFQIICSRVRELKEDKIRVLWVHDLPEDPELSILKTSSDKFHKIVFVSNWQLQQFVEKLGLKQDHRLAVIENPIDINPLGAKASTDQINLVYFSTPQRGLEILVPVFEELAKKYPNVHLQVHSSFAIYGWHEADAHFDPLYDRIRQHLQMTYHGFTPHSELQSKLVSDYHILAYPSIWKETSCRVLIESMSAGLLCVHPNLAALPETAGGLTTMYQFQDDVNAHANLFYQYLDHAVSTLINERENFNSFASKFVKPYIDNRFNRAAVGYRWNNLFKELAEQYPNEASRKFPVEMFRYKTL